MSTSASVIELKDPRIHTEFVEANGLRFEVDVCGSGDRLALCLHGFPEHSISWRHQLPMLADLGYRAWAPNLRGYGNSSRPEGMAAYSIECLMDDVAGLIDASGASETVLIAHDWGAVIAWHFAIRKLRPLVEAHHLQRTASRARSTGDAQWHGPVAQILVHLLLSDSASAGMAAGPGPGPSYR